MTPKLVMKTAKCKRCASETVAWEQGTKWYLVEVFTYDSGTEYESLKADRRDFHSKYCGKPELHAKEQAEILGDEQEKNVRQEEREQKVAAETAAYFLGLHDMCKADPDAAHEMVAELERKVALFNGDWYISMDTLTDHARQREEVKKMQTEISFLNAALGISVYED